MKGHSSDDGLVAADATTEATEDRSPCAEPTLAKPSGGSSSNTITVDAGGGCRVVIDLRVTVDGGCGAGPSGPTLTDPPDPTSGGGPPDPEMPVTLYRQGVDKLTAFVLWAKNSRLEEVQTAHQAGFKLQNNKPLSLFMTALTDDKKLWYRGFGVADLRYMQKATAITAPGHSDVQAVKTGAYGCHISGFDFDPTLSDGLKIDVTYKLDDPHDNRMRAVVIMPSEIAPPGGKWEHYLAQGGFSHPEKAQAEHHATVEKIIPPSATQKLYAFVVLTELPVDDPSALPVIDSPVRVLVG